MTRTPPHSARLAVAPAAALAELSADDAMAALLDHADDPVAAAVARVDAATDGLLVSLVTGDLPDALAVPLRDGDPRRLVARPVPDDDAEADVLRHELTRLAATLARLAEAGDRERRLRTLAMTDELTGCANKRYFRTFLDRILARAKIERFPVTLLLFDIDDFKHYNDRHGHPVGDEILRQTADLMKRCTRDHDLVARIGGDEFAVVFWEREQAGGAGTSPATRGEKRGQGRFPAGPLQIAARFRKLLNDESFAALGQSGVGRLTISGGMAVYPYDGGDADTLIEAADRALMSGAKRSGKNSIALVGGEG